jgi:hypothetical protein
MVPFKIINGWKVYLASPITRRLLFGDTSTYLKKFVNPSNRVLLKASDFGVSGPKAWAVDINGIQQLMENSKASPNVIASMKRELFGTEKPQNLEEAIVSRPELVIELATKIKKIKEENERLQILSHNMDILMKDCDSILHKL